MTYTYKPHHEVPLHFHELSQFLYARTGVMSVMADKDVEGILAIFEPHFEHLVVTQTSQARAMRAEELGVIAVEVFGEDRVTVIPNLADALEAAMTLAEDDSDSFNGGAVLVTGSVVTVGEARHLLARRDRTRARD